jgi:hypothetical protein
VLGDDHPDTIRAASNYATARKAAGHPLDLAPTTRPGEPVADQVAALEAAARSATHIDIDQAASLYRKAIALLRQQTPVDEKRIAADEMLEAEPLLAGHEKATALHCLRDALEIDDRLLGPRDPTTVAVATRLADVLDEKHPDEAAAVRTAHGLPPTARP